MSLGVSDEIARPSLVVLAPGDGICSYISQVSSVREFEGRHLETTAMTMAFVTKPGIIAIVPGKMIGEPTPMIVPVINPAMIPSPCVLGSKRLMTRTGPMVHPSPLHAICTVPKIDELRSSAMTRALR